MLLFWAVCSWLALVAAEYVLTTPPELQLASPRVDAAAVGVNDLRGVPLVVLAGFVRSFVRLSIVRLGFFPFSFVR